MDLFYHRNGEFNARYWREAKIGFDAIVQSQAQPTYLSSDAPKS